MHNHFMATCLILQYQRIANWVSWEMIFADIRGKFSETKLTNMRFREIRKIQAHFANYVQPGNTLIKSCNCMKRLSK